MQVESNQGTDQWQEDRSKFITASRFVDVMAYGKANADQRKKGLKNNGKPLATRDRYKADKTIERVIGMDKHDVNSKSMSHGKEFEPIAKEMYEAKTGLLVMESNFIQYNEFIGCSPDGLVGDDGGIECKCPYDEYVHFMTVINNKMPDDHMPQVQGSMMVTDRQWWDFISYDPRFPQPMQMFIERIYRNDEYIDEMLAEIIKFNSEVNDYVDQLKRKFNF